MSLISEFATGVYSVFRAGSAGEYKNGRFIEPSVSVLKMRLSVQPLLAREAQVLPEGERDRESYKVFSDRELKSSRQYSVQEADMIVIKGEKYRVRSCERWNESFDLPYYMAIVQRLDKQDGQKT